jgi:hypothetical protein
MGCSVIQLRVPAVLQVLQRLSVARFGQRFAIFVLS